MRKSRGVARAHWREGADRFGDRRSSGGEEPEGLKGSLAEASCEEPLLGFWWTPWLFPRLVLPYVRHLKGEDDKPLPPTKPRKQYKMAKELRGDDGTTEKPKKAKDPERHVDQVSAEQREVVVTAPTPPLARAADSCLACWEPAARAGAG